MFENILVSNLFLPLFALVFLIDPYDRSLVVSPQVYERAGIELGCFNTDLGHCYGCDSRRVVSIRPLFNDAGLPLYKIFRELNYELVGFEFRIVDGDFPFRYSGFSIMLSKQEFFQFKIIW